MNRVQIRHGDEESLINWISSTPEADKKVSSLITTISQCQTNSATHMLIPSPTTILTCESELSIGGTFNKDKKELWFFCSISQCHGNNNLLSIFVISRSDNRFSLTLSKNAHDLNQIKVDKSNKWSTMTGPTKKYHFVTSRKDELFFVKTYCFTKEDLLILGDYPLLLSCAIEIHESYRVHPDIISRLKFQYTDEANEALYKIRNKGDFIIESITHTKHPMHLIVAAAHSSTLKDAIIKNNKSYAIDLNDDDVETLIEFLYKGSIENLSLDNAPNILLLALKMGIPGMLKLGETVLSTEINVDNAVEIALLAKKYGLNELLMKVLEFINQNPKLLFSSSIESLNDVDLMRRMLRHVGMYRLL